MKRPERKSAVIPGDAGTGRPARVTAHGLAVLSQVDHGMYAYSRYVGVSGGFEFADGRPMTHYQAETLILLWELLFAGFLHILVQDHGGKGEASEHVRITPRGLAALNATRTTKGNTTEGTAA